MPRFPNSAIEQNENGNVALAFFLIGVTVPFSGKRQILQARKTYVLLSKGTAIAFHYTTTT